MEALSDGWYLVRWIHLLAAMGFVGLGWTWLLVTAPYAAGLSPAERAGALPSLLPRALWWLRWAAATTWVSGMAYALGVLARADPQGALHWVTETSRGQWVAFAFLLGSVMTFNVWFIIWPSQDRVVRGLAGAADPARLAAWAATATRAARLNAYLSLPVLFAMGAGRHLGEAGGALPTSFPVAAGGCLLLGGGLAAVLLHVVAPRAGRA